MLVTLDRSLDLPLHQQLYRALRDQILTGELEPGFRLPSTRSLSDSLQVARNVVLQAYEQLHADGLLLSRHGSGTFVAGLGGPAPAPAPAALEPRPGLPAPPAPPRPLAIDFRTGMPDVAAFPRSLWGRLLQRALREMEPQALGYGPVAGDPALREAIAGHLRHSRGVRAEAANVVVTSGATQALSLLAELLVEPGDLVLCENPCHPVVRSMFQRRGARITGVPVDGVGIDLAALEQVLRQAAGRPRLLYLTPSHQFPSGAVLEPARRQALVALAGASGFWIIEDDYDSEIRHTGPPLPALQSMAPGHVIYVGSFSKLLAPSLRLGYAILPPGLEGPFQGLKYTTDYHTPTIDQRALAAFICEGHLQRHLARVRRQYRAGRALLMAEVARSFGDRARLYGDATGLHLWLEVKSPKGGLELAAAAARQGVGVYPLASFYDPPESAPAGCHLVLGYGALSPEEIRRGIRTLAAAAGR